MGRRGCERIVCGGRDVRERLNDRNRAIAIVQAYRGVEVHRVQTALSSRTATEETPLGEVVPTGTATASPEKYT